MQQCSQDAARGIIEGREDPGRQCLQLHVPPGRLGPVRMLSPYPTLEKMRQEAGASIDLAPTHVTLRGLGTSWTLMNLALQVCGRFPVTPPRVRQVRT